MGRSHYYQVRLSSEERGLFIHAAARFGWNVAGMIRYAVLRFMRDHYVESAELAERDGRLKEAREFITLARLYGEAAQKRRDLTLHRKRGKWEMARE